MPEKKSRPADRPVHVDTLVKGVLVAKNRTVEPYFHQFSILPENIAQESLGRLVGVFSISDHSKSSSYIGNVIASVAKREYFANTHRGAVESFEGTLHKINLALSEIVKEGNTRFMGHLHGAVAVIENGNIHFSGTGEGRILLFRDGSLLDIGDGLASEEAATHPMKSFVEISSGRLLPGDCVVLSSPELFTVFSAAELSQNAKRLIPDGRFGDFLETAMTNALRAGAALVITATERRHPETEPGREKRRGTGKKRKGRETIYFSDKTFREAQQEHAAEILEADLRTASGGTKSGKEDEGNVPRHGTIYVKGEAAPETEGHPWLTLFRWKSELLAERCARQIGRIRHEAASTFRETSHTLSLRIGQSLRSVKTSLGRTLRKAARRMKPARRDGSWSERKDTDTKKETGTGTGTDSREHNPILVRALKTVRDRTSEPKSRPTAGKPAHEKDFLGISRRFLRETGFFAGRLSDTIGTAARRISGSIGPLFLRISRSLIGRISSLPPKPRLLLAAGTAFVLTLGGIGLRNALIRPEAVSLPPTILIEEPRSAFPPAGERDAILADLRTIPPGTETIVTTVPLRGRLFTVTETGITDTETGSSARIPSDSPVFLATGMDDLSLVFLLTRSGELFSYAPSNGTFSKNDIGIPAGFRPTGIGSFLTYLYLLDGPTGNIYRYPRAEGGFGEGIVWTSAPVGTNSTGIAINGTVYVASDSEVTSLFRGKPSADFGLELPTNPLRVTAVCADEEVPDRFAVLDTSQRRVLLYADDGSFIRQYFHESFGRMTGCSLDGTGGRIIVFSPNETASFPVDPE